MWFLAKIEMYFIQSLLYISAHHAEQDRVHDEQRVAPDELENTLHAKVHVADLAELAWSFEDTRGSSSHGCSLSPSPPLSISPSFVT